MKIFLVIWVLFTAASVTLSWWLSAPLLVLLPLILLVGFLSGYLAGDSKGQESGWVSGYDLGYMHGEDDANSTSPQDEGR